MKNKSLQSIMPKKGQVKNNILERKVDTLDKRFDQHAKENKAEHKSLHKEIKDSEERVLRHFDVVAEDLKGEIRIVAEQCGSLQENMQSLKDDTEIIKANLHRKMDYEEFVSLERRVSLLEKKLT